MRALLLASGLFLLPGVCGCVRMQAAEFFQITEEAPANRAMQTRIFETADDRELLSASTAELQDLGFQVEEVARDAGFVRAVKERSARERGQDIGRFLLMLVSFCYFYMPIDLQQKISATLVVRPVNAAATRYEVRVIFYRVIWQGDGYAERNYIAPGDQRMEVIRDPEIYRQFFAGLSKAVFLEGFTL